MPSPEELLLTLNAPAEEKTAPTPHPNTIDDVSASNPTATHMAVEENTNGAGVAEQPAADPEAANTEAEDAGDVTKQAEPAVILAGLVIKDQSGFFWVETEEGEVYRCRLRGRLLEEAQSSDIAAIGDRVTFSVTDTLLLEGAIETVEPRTHVISRAMRTEGSRGAGAAEREQIIIANPDQALFVFAAAQPDPSPRMLDRFLVVGEKAGLHDLIIVVNKCDLADMELTRRRFGIYEKTGYRVLYTSALQLTGISELRDVLRGKISAFTGPSGVGKTSLLNEVQPGLGRATKAVSGWSQEGVHTTRDSALIKLEFGGYLADTPGMRTFTIWDVEPSELDAYFVEIAARIHACRFTNCTHRDEPGCAVRQAVAKGEVSATRYKSYLALYAELEEAYALY